MRKNNINIALFLIIFLLAVSCSKEHGIDKNKFRKLSDAAHSVKTALAGGASYRQLSDRVQNLAAEVSALKNEVTVKEEKDLLDAYSMEHFEIACYTALTVAAERAGLTEVVHACRQIIPDEERMAQTLRHALPDEVKSYLFETAEDAD